MALIDTLGTAVSALQSFNAGLDTVADNIANVDTTAYKTSSTSFADTLTGGVQVDSTSTNFGQGSLQSTGVNTNLAISGNGYFIVQTGGAQYYTRDGGFNIQPSGTSGISNLVNEQGAQVLGISAPGGTALSPIQIASANGSGSALQSVSITTNGQVIESFADGTTSTAGYVALQNFANQSALVSAGNNLYTNPSSGNATTLNAPGSSGLGTVLSGMIEQSNVDLTSEFSNMITMQRAFEANSRVMTTSDTVLQDVIQMIQP